MIALPLSWVERLARWHLIHRPPLLCIEVNETPLEVELGASFLYREVRGGFAKWAHLRCPRCRAHIQVPIAVGSQWQLKVDWLRRPTLHPSIWETESCGAHFFLRRGDFKWCE